MVCRICALNNHKLINEIEHILAKNSGKLFTREVTKLCEEYPAYVEQLKAITDRDSSIHFNFHQQVVRCPSSIEDGEATKGSRLVDDIGKDEAEVLYDLLNQQAATFTALSKKINDTIINNDRDSSALLVHPETTRLYETITMSMRATVRELRELDLAKNGEKDGAVEGLKALAAAIVNSKTAKSVDEDMTTKEFDE